MKEVPDYEKYPVGEDIMGKRYKNWTEALARQLVLMYRVGKEVGGKKFVERLKEEYYKDGQKGAHLWMKLTGTKPEDFKDCSKLHLILDLIDDTYANYWNGYIENSTDAFEKELYTCPVVRWFSREPEICQVLLGESSKGLASELNPKLKAKGFSKLLTKGDKVCRYRFELQK
jgi:hypothetical protein